MATFNRFTSGCALSLGLIVISAQSQIATDGTVGPKQALTGPNYSIGADLGTQRGANLFHSFQTFNIHTGENATFTGPSGLQNVISRVTGGELSNIDGTLRSEIAGANFFFINPAGVVFGANARLDVPAAFHVSTADELRFADGAAFSATNPGMSTLSAAPIAAFGFTSAVPKQLEVNESLLIVNAGQTLSLVGGDITLTNATVYAPAGRINVASVGSPGEIAPTETDLELRGFGALGTLTMVRDPDIGRWGIDLGEPFGQVALGDLDTSGASSGALFIRGGQWFNQNGTVLAETYGVQTGHGIDVAINKLIYFTGDDSSMRADTWGSGTAGLVTVKTGDLTLLNGGLISTAAWGAGNASSVTISVRNLRVDREDSKNWTGISSSAYPDSTGDGGNVSLTVADTLSVLNGGIISTSTFAAGDAGSVAISASNLLVDGQGSEYFTGITSSAYPDSTGAGGDISLTIADTLTLLNTGQISASAWGSGNGGSMTVTVGRAANFSGGLEIDGYLYPSGLSVGAEGTGQAGKLTITTPRLTLTDGGGISAQSTKTTGGNLFINAADLRLFNNSLISTSVYGDAMTEGGNVEINSRTIVAFDSSTITAQATQGKGGHIVINTDAFFHNAASIDDVLSASSGVSGNNGTVDVNTAIDVSSAVGVGSHQSDLRDAAQDPCAQRKGQKKSTLTKVGRGGLPGDNRPEGMTVSLGSGDWTPTPLGLVEPAPTVQEPLILNADRENCRL